MIFELNWGTYDSEQHWLFSHDNKTREEFKVDCDELIVKYGAKYIDNAGDRWVGTNRWVEYITGQLPTLGYIPIDPIGINYEGTLIIRDYDRDDEWAKLVGEVLLDKAVKHNFMYSLGNDSEIYIINNTYHVRDCRVLLNSWRKRVFSFKWSDLERLPPCEPCEICNPEKP